MTMDTTREEMTQAVLEGVVFGLRDSFEVAKKLGIQIERTKICGGGAKSPLWRQMVADILNVKVDIPENAARYEKQYQKFRRIYPTVKELFPVIE